MLGEARRCMAASCEAIRGGAPSPGVSPQWTEIGLCITRTPPCTEGLAFAHMPAPHPHLQCLGKMASSHHSGVHVFFQCSQGCLAHECCQICSCVPGRQHSSRQLNNADERSTPISYFRVYSSNCCIQQYSPTSLWLCTALDRYIQHAELANHGKLAKQLWRSRMA